MYKIKMGLKWFLALAINEETLHSSYDFMVYNIML